LSDIESKADMINGNILIRKNKIVEYLENKITELNKEIRSSFINDFLKGAEKGIIDEKNIYKVIENISKIFENRQGEIEKEVEKRVISVLIELKEDFEMPLKELKQKAIEFFNIDIEIPQEATEFKFLKKPYFVDKNFSFSYKLLKDNLFFKILPSSFKKKIILAHLKNDFDDIILRNSNNIRWETIQSIQDTFIKYEAYYYDKYENIKESILDSLDKVKKSIVDFKETKEIKIHNMEIIYNEIIELAKGI
jgi:hypothetical protein